MSKPNRDYRALRICELPNEVTYFPLYIEKEGLIVPYTSGRHAWSTEEKIDLLQNSQFVLFFDSISAAEVEGHLRDSKVQSLGGEDFSLTIADGISEFIKTRHQFDVTSAQAAIFRGLATALSRYLYQQPRIRDLLEQLAIHDAYSFYHGFRTAAYAVALHSQDKAWDIALGAILHDLGNLFISPLILNRRGALHESEWKAVRKHPEEGHKLLQGQNLSPITLDLVLHHHERPDGQGYPHRFKKKDLTREVRLLSFVEVFTALTEPRPYQTAHNHSEALHLMQTGLSSYLDESLFTPLLKLMGLDDTQRQVG